jgi:hypothetical protein
MSSRVEHTANQTSCAMSSVIASVAGSPAMAEGPSSRSMRVAQDRRNSSAAITQAVRACGDAIYLGSGDAGWAWAQPERSVLALGPSRSGKSSALVIPNVLAARGAVVSTSTKPDVLRATARYRSARGPAFLYDPSGTVDLPPDVRRIGWSPVDASSSWDSALLTADTMVRAAHPSQAPGTTQPHDSHWLERATALLAPLLYAAHVTDEPMATVVGWVDRHCGSEALEALAAGGDAMRTPCDLLAGILTTEAREQSGIWSTASGLLGVFRTRAGMESTELRRFDPESFCDGPSTLYICATGHRQQAFAPLVVSVLGHVREAAYQRAARGSTGPPVLLAIDEAANIAPIADLPTMVSEGGGQGLQSLVCLQDLSQARARWGARADGFVSLFGTTVVLGGIGDLRTLEMLSALAGDEEVPTQTVGVTPDHRARVRRTSTTSTILRRRLTVDTIARGRPGAALALDSRNRFGWISLSPAYRCRPWADLAGPVRQRPGLTLDRSSGWAARAR